MNGFIITSSSSQRIDALRAGNPVRNSGTSVTRCTSREQQKTTGMRERNISSKTLRIKPVLTTGQHRRLVSSRAVGCTVKSFIPQQFVSFRHRHTSCKVHLPVQVHNASEKRVNWMIDVWAWFIKCACAWIICRIVMSAGSGNYKNKNTEAWRWNRSVDEEQIWTLKMSVTRSTRVRLYVQMLTKLRSSRTTIQKKGIVFVTSIHTFFLFFALCKLSLSADAGNFNA